MLNGLTPDQEAKIQMIRDFRERSEEAQTVPDFKVEYISTLLTIVRQLRGVMELIGEENAELGGHFGLERGATTRLARCHYYGSTHRWAYDAKRIAGPCDDQGSFMCWCVKPADASLPLFEARPTQPYDRFFCGCHGWD